MKHKRTAAPGLPTIERRTVPLVDMELRAEGADGLLTFEGYASVVERAYDVAGGPPYGFSETIARTAFDKTLAEAPDVVFLINHEGLQIARTTSGTLRLSADKTGLRVEADLDPDDPDVQRIRPKLERGDVDEMSFAFKVLRQEWDEDYVERRITELSLHRGDVSLVSFGANPHTSGTMRADDLDPDLLARDHPELVLAAYRSLNTFRTYRVLDAVGVPDGWRDPPSASGADEMSVDYARALAESLRRN